MQFADRPEMWVSHETIYQAIYVHARGNLRAELSRAGSGVFGSGVTAAAGDGGRRGALQPILAGAEHLRPAGQGRRPGGTRHRKDDLVIGATARPRWPPWSNAPPGSCCSSACPTGGSASTSSPNYPRLWLGYPPNCTAR
jgi:hypothetical protein